MSYGSQSHINATVGLQYHELLGKVFFSTLTTITCCVFLSINGVMLFTLRSKPVFWETSRYILLFNLILADTLLLAQSQTLYILASFRIFLTYPVCGAIVKLADITNVISPLTLVAISLERYVAVCYPLNHSTIITVRNTVAVIISIWAFSLLNVLIRVILLLEFPFEDLGTLQMKDFCSATGLMLGQSLDHYDKAYTCLLFVSAFVAITSSYVGVTVAARSASTDKASSIKARNTLLLHLLHLGLNLLSNMQSTLLKAIAKRVSRVVYVRITVFTYVCITLTPRCFSAVIYGFRDQTIRAILTHQLSCWVKVSVIKSIQS
ncbi:odorant receptor 131-2-like [Sphaeramia orbicularis]|uniref:odorant receptor 131-2-like n=1 Tax=Sphaeramia orbicularis TaxID=375764 RepID=UPI00117F34A8|nr:odorant receptor 131-2-like [Sphaeramia orbicularis]